MATSIKCPTCKSTNVQKISTGSKLGSALMWGVLAANKLKSTYRARIVNINGDKLALSNSWYYL
jgi:hypothetical protein